MVRISTAGRLTLVLALAWALPAAASFVPFESGPVRPLALSPDGTRLFACNIPDNRLEIFQVDAGGLLHLAGIPVGLEPVAVAARSNGEVWVVNHLSDSVSIVDVSAAPPRVVRTLLVGDEPRDIVFAGSGGNRAFISTARRGQNDPADPELTTAGVGRANVWVFDADALGAAAGGTPLAVLTLFGDTPRPLAVSPDGSKVYAGIFHSGNQTTSLPEGLVHAGIPGLGPLEPNQNVPLDPNEPSLPAPNSGLIAKLDPNGDWLDAGGQDWTAFVPFDLPDKDVFQIDADATPPLATAFFKGVGTILFNMAVNPANGSLYVSNGDAQNHVRFEGAGIHGGSTVRGNLHQYRITVIDPNSAVPDPNAASVTPIHLNKHIDYALDPAATVAAGVAAHSLATPLDMAIRSDGSKLYVAAFGSSKVGVFDPTALESNAFAPSDANHIDISGGGPAGLALDEGRNRLYVLARFDNSISVVDLGAAPGSEIDVVPLPHDPEPASVRDGRPFLYDARLTSSNGEASCSSCHIFARMDDLAWDLGDPDGVQVQNNNVQALDVIADLGSLIVVLTIGGVPIPDGLVVEHHPMKGPMLTQSLRGLANHGPMHWRGDRSGANKNVGSFWRNDPESLNEEKAFKAFNVAFEALLGRESQLSGAEMQAFTDFMLQVPYPPNPIRNLDDSLTPDQAAGRNIYMNIDTDGQVGGLNSFTCNECHTLDVAEPNGGFFGTNGESSFDGEPQIFKVPHLRNVYQRIGMFGIVGTAPSGTMGDQIRGYGFLHDGIVDTLFSFVSGAAFTFPGDAAQQELGQRQVEDFMLAFDTNFAPILGQQVTLDANGPSVPLLPSDADTVGDRIDLLVARGLVSAPREECDLVVKGNLDGEMRGWHMIAADAFVPDRVGEPTQTEADLRQLAATSGAALTFSCVPPGSGNRIGIDRDQDGIVDGSECGDSNGDGVSAANDPGVLRLVLAGVLPPEQLSGAKCNVIGAIDQADADGDGIPDDCTIQDWAVQLRDALTLGPGITQACAAAL
jgi:DNA-binding beta-propeller fold protein YncE